MMHLQERRLSGAACSTSKAALVHNLRPLQHAAAPHMHQSRLHLCHNGLFDRISTLFGRTNSKTNLVEVARRDALLELLAPTERGLLTSKKQRSEILAAVEALQSTTQGSTTTGQGLSATWRLLWTTEKETLFILQNAKLFGTEAGDVFQVIDVDEGTLQNVITFPPEGAFIVNSSIEVEGPQRVEFQFTGATLQLPRRDLTLPPFGKGWFDNIYVSDSLRVAQDSRGDTLIVERAGAPQVFGN